jgi:uncharacterized protein
MNPSLKLSLLPSPLVICRLEANAPIPDWALLGNFFSITRTSDELSVVCSETWLPSDIKAEGGWRGLKVSGPLDFSLTGILAGLANTLARVGVSIFAISTYDTDYILVKEKDLEKAISALKEAGNQLDYPV